MSLFSVLSIANRGLTASQMGLDVTGQNIANASTEGYSRKRVTLSADYGYNNSYGQMGMGVEIENVARIRDESIDVQIRRQNHQFGYFEEMDSTLEAVENIFNEPSDTGIISYIDQFFDSWNNLANNPADLAARTMVKTAGETLSGVFANAASELSNLRASKNFNVESTVFEINKIGREIYNLNKEIASVELSGQNANDSRDARDVLMADLAKLVEYDAIEAPDGQMSITIGGNIFISGVSTNNIELYTSDETQRNAGYLQYSVKMEGLQHPLKITGGKLKGLMDMRDINIPEYEKALDELAVSIMETVNFQHQQGYNLNGYSGFDFFDPSTTGADDLQVSAAVLSNVANIAAAKGGTQATGATNVVPAGDLNFGNTPIDLSKNLGRPWTTADPSAEKATNIVNGSVTMKIAATGAVLIEGIDYSINYVDGTAQMLHSSYDGTAIDIDFDYMVGSFPGPGNNENAVEMGKLRDFLSMSPDHLGNNTSTFTDFYSGLIGSVGLDRNEAASNKDTREYLIEQYHDSQESIAGVSLDEEMSNLIKFQHTYQAAAKIVSTTQQMLDVLMNL